MKALADIDCYYGKILLVFATVAIPSIAHWNAYE